MRYVCLCARFVRSRYSESCRWQKLRRVVDILRGPRVLRGLKVPRVLRVLRILRIPSIRSLTRVPTQHCTFQRMSKAPRPHKQRNHSTTKKGNLILLSPQAKPLPHPPEARASERRESPRPYLHEPFNHIPHPPSPIPIPPSRCPIRVLLASNTPSIAAAFPKKERKKEGRRIKRKEPPKTEPGPGRALTSFLGTVL